MTDEEWQEAAELGEKIVHEALTETALKNVRSDKPTEYNLALLLGGIVAAGTLMRLLVQPEGHRTLEIAAIAYLRGAIRNSAEGPCTEDGSPYKGAYDA